MHNTRFVLENGKEIYPGYLDPDKRKQLQMQYKNKRQFMWCGCRSDEKLYYRISEDLRIYPEHNGYQHDKQCIRYMDENKERTTAYVIDDESGNVTAYLAFNPKNLIEKEEVSDKEEQENQEDNEEQLEESMEEMIIEKESTEKTKEKKEPKLTLASLIRCINIDTYTDKILNDKKLLSREDFSKQVYFRMQRVRPDRMKKSLGELTLETDKVRFLYLLFDHAIQKNDGGTTKCYIVTKGADGKTYNNLILPDTLAKVVKEYKKQYGIEPDENTMIAGFQYLKKSRGGYKYRILGRIHMFQISDIGLYSRSLTEMTTYNRLTSLVQEDNKLRFWLPADDDYVGGVIEVQGKHKKILLLFRGKNDEYMVINKDLYEPLVIGEESITKEELYRFINNLN